jgi:hypothetical protein
MRRREFIAGLGGAAAASALPRAALAQKQGQYPVLVALRRDGRDIALRRAHSSPSQ